jgi:hypothetical protein
MLKCFFDSLIVKLGQIMRSLRLLGSHLLGINTKNIIEEAIATKLNQKLQQNQKS